MLSGFTHLPSPIGQDRTVIFFWRLPLRNSGCVWMAMVLSWENSTMVGKLHSLGFGTCDDLCFLPRVTTFPVPRTAWWLEHFVDFLGISSSQLMKSNTGWWFGCHFWHFPINIGLLIMPIDVHIFQRGFSTTNQNIYQRLGEKNTPTRSIDSSLISYQVNPCRSHHPCLESITISNIVPGSIIPAIPGWLVVWNIFYFPIYWVANHPNWLIFFRGVQTTNQWKKSSSQTKRIPGNGHMSCGLSIY